MSLQDISIDLDDLSFEVPRRANNKNFGGSIYKEVVPPAITVQRVPKPRNRPCIPSDDEDSDEDDEDDDQSILSSEENDLGPSPRVQSALRSNTPVVVSTTAKKPVRKSQPLPSDDEDSEDDDDDDDGEEEQRNQNAVSKKNNQRNMHHSAYQPVQVNTPVIVEEEQEADDDDNEALLANRDPNAGPILTLVEGSHLQQLHQMQQYHQAKLALFQHQIQPSKSNSANMRRQQHGNGRTMSGMDLLKQLEQEKADAKRIKPKQQQQQAYHYNQQSRSPSPINHRSLSPNHNRSPSPNTRSQPNRNMDHRGLQQPSYSQ
ncbi:uncharacterized protein EV154DRAFT_551442 [Mucor mucedo]|uniref:uncharacterized protein n=1 Tax=Mucor mucedo TaxID=29922 RepID=UPI00221E450E|nr:uncharacterized protein EV154DRAFT_551442 [Mucor mucedo]KAI7891485.1 hypothetical protein EV154DRAFT_551442 [Mucor mucedo]